MSGCVAWRAVLVAVAVVYSSAAQASPDRLRSELLSRIAAAAPGDVVRAPAGVIAGPLRVDKSLTLIGDGTTIDGMGAPRVLVLDAPDVELSGFVVRASGHDLGGPDACLYLTARAARARVVGNQLEACAFGIWVHETEQAVLDGNRITGSTSGHRSNRGNGIHLFNATKLTVKNNIISGGRDGIYVAATEDSLIEGNRISDTRYGVHYMYSYRNEVRNNRADGNVTGFALMESQRIRLTRNTATGNQERGILFRDVQYCHIEANVVSENGEGLFFFSSTENVILGNHIADNRVGAKIWAGTRRNQLTRNAFTGNAQQVFYVGTSDLRLAAEQPGNYYSDYLGWDQNSDGVGDRPYRVDSFTTRLVHRFPVATLLLRSPALELLGHLQQRMPLLRVPTVIDERPLMSRSIP